MKSRLKLTLCAGVALLSPLAARSGDLQQEFQAAHAKSLQTSTKSRPYIEANAAQPEITQVGLERASGFSADSPVYTVIIKSDGTFSFAGNKNCTHPGNHTGHIATNDISSLFQYVSEADFFALNDAYAAAPTDQDQVYIMAAKAGERKIVSNYGNGGPMKLWALEQVIDAVLGRAAWDDAK